MQPRPLTYRAEIIRPLLESLDAGECCSVVGVNGMGKTNLLQQLRRPDLLADRGAAEPLTFIALDANLLAAPDEWGFFEGLAEALAAGAPAELPPATYEALRAAHGAILAVPGNAAIALRCCGNALGALLAHTRLVLIFDEFDGLFTGLPAQTLRNLRGLRDRHKYRLMYLTLSREPLADLRDPDEWDAVEPFVELFMLRQLGLGPLAAEDAAREVDRFAGRHRTALADQDRQRIVELSGGHPALVRALTQVFLILPAAAAADPAALLDAAPALADECAKIWNALSGDEQAALIALLRGGQERIPAHLLLKGLVRRAPGVPPAIFSPLLRAAIERFQDVLAAPPAPQPPSPSPAPATAPSRPLRPIAVDRQARRVYYYGREIGDQLPDLRFRLLAHLAEHYGEVCPQLDLARAVYDDAGKDDYNDRERVSTLIKRVRQTLAKATPPGQPEPLQVIRGVGVRLGLPTSKI